MLLANNLLKKLERLQSEMQEVSSADRNQKLDMHRVELEAVNSRVTDGGTRFKGWLLITIFIIFLFLIVFIYLLFHFHNKNIGNLQKWMYSKQKSKEQINQTS